MLARVTLFPCRPLIRPSILFHKLFISSIFTAEDSTSNGLACELKMHVSNHLQACPQPPAARSASALNPTLGVSVNFPVRVTKTSAATSIFDGVLAGKVKITPMPGQLLLKKMLFALNRKAALVVGLAALTLTLGASTVSDYDTKIKPMLEKYCYDCHADGMDKGQVTLDHFKSGEEVLAADDLWYRVLKNVRAEVMPPAKKKTRPTPEEIKELENWIKYSAFGLDPKNVDPGRVTVRRLNRVEYRNTIRDLMGVDFNTTEEFPPDDTGYGFDNIGDGLTISPLLLEKYFEAAEKIVGQAVPTVAKQIRKKTIEGNQLKGEGVNGDNLNFYKDANIAYTTKLDTEGDYKITLDMNVRGSFNFDGGKALVVFKMNGEEKLRKEFGWDANKKHEITFDEKLSAGEHKFTIEIQPLVKEEERTESQRRDKTFVNLKINSVDITGPLDPKHWARTKNYDRFFFKDEVPQDPDEKRAYAREVLARFTKKAFRRPVDDKTIDRLTGFAVEAYTKGGKKFEQAVGQSIVAVIASPRFLYRVEESSSGTDKIASIDEYSLASRLSYFLWSTMPDDELLSLAEKGQLRSNLKKQVNRMLKDGKADQLVKNFTGQWLQTRDVEGIAINERAVFFRDSDTPAPKPGERRRGFGRIQPKFELDGELRRAMQDETQEYFKHIMREDRSVLEMLDSDYTFLNEKLAKVYEIPGVEGRQMRKVTLPEGSPRGGMLTHGSILVVTSNPTRTSLVKRGLFLLDNFFGTPPPPPPPNTPDLEEAAKEFKDREPTLRETLEEHRKNPLCFSCHERMDPLGFALENFNALGAWREKERGQPIDPAGKLITGEEFKDIRDLRKILVTERYMDFYRCFTEKLLTYALGRGLEYYDVEAVDRIVERLDEEKGRFSAVLMGVVESAPFQKRRNVSAQSADANERKETVAAKN